jgi:uncharacterized SAM-binding protein YcdF (DUF218 family)
MTGRRGRTQSSSRPNSPPRLSLGERLRDLLLVAFAFGTGAALLLGYTTLRVWQVGQQDGRHKADAIVVMGAAQYNGRPSPVLAARLDHAIELWKEGYAPYLVTTGGNLPGDVYTEAQTGSIYAQKRGVPASAIIMEDTGRSTLDSIGKVKAIFEGRGLKTALFVSDRSHMLRVLRLAQDAGIQAWSSPTETSPDDINPSLWQKSIVHEVGALGYYMITSDDPDGSAASAASDSVPSPGAAAR